MYVKIIDKGECFSTTMEFINGVYANKTEWAKYNFYPKNGMVGEVVKRTPSAYIVKIAEGIYVPMTRNGIREISFEEYKNSLDNNKFTGMDEKQKRINDQVDSFISDSRCTLPDMREAFKQDIIQNITKLTCDFSRNIFLPDLEKSAYIYALNMCLEYQEKSGRELGPNALQQIVEQVCDAYKQLFGHQFTEEVCQRVLTKVSFSIHLPEARHIIDKYYEAVNFRYNWK